MAAIIKRLQSARSLLNWLKTVDGSGSGLDADTVDGSHASAFALASDIATGVIVPTLTIVSNLDSVTAGAVWYIRFQNLVVMWGAFTADATAAASTTTRMGMSLPVASNFTGAGQAAGVMGTSGVNSEGTLYADATNDRIEFWWPSQSTASQTFRFSGGYTVI